jgi:hypothetical protein
MIKASVPLLLAMLLLTSCATRRPSWAALPRFKEQDRANLIVRYYTDDTSYVLKPKKADGRFLTILNKEAVLDVAKQQPDRQLAVVILIHYGADSQAATVKHQWSNLLTEAGYQRVVFLRALNSMQVNGLPVLAGGADAPATASATGIGHPGLSLYAARLQPLQSPLAMVANENALSYPARE